MWRRDGEEQVVYIHVEVQAQRQESFGQRMHVYNYRVYDRYRKPVVSLAILADDRPEWKPDNFSYELWGCKVSQKGEATILRRQLTRRFDGLPGWVEERLAQASREQLESWADRVLDAERLEDVFSSA